MLNNATIEKLREMNLRVMADKFHEQLSDNTAQGLDFEERFGCLVDAEWASRKSNHLRRLIKSAGFEFPSACLEDVEYHADRKLDKAALTRLGTCAFVNERRNIIILGATGTGKTWLSNAFGIAACRNFFTVKYIRLPELLAELAVAKAEGTYNKIIKQYQKVKLLILDEWLLYPLKDVESRDLLEIVESRHKKSSTIFCSQFDIGDWHAQIGAATMADAVVDRIVHDSYRIVIEGAESMRKRKGIPVND
jgi:DNA replication protein DnaC